MRLVTYSQGPGGAARVGVRVGHRVLDIESGSRVNGEPLPNTMKTLLREGRGALSRVQALAKAAQSSAGRYSGAMHEERAIRFLPPVPDADKLVCDGNPVRLNASLVGHNTKVAIPAGTASVACEPELVFVIGRRVFGFAADADAMDYVVGVTMLNDLANGDAQAREGGREIVGREILGPIGPEIVTLDEIGDPYDLWITCLVNGEERLRVNTGPQVHDLGEVLQRFSRDTALEPGDMVSAGTLAGKGGANTLSLKPGDVVECSIEGFTTLRTTLVAE
jgi:hypothetical protein